MNNFIDYYYGIKEDNIIYNETYYSFTYKGYLYKLYKILDNININQVVNINKKLIRHTLMGEICLNRFGKAISIYNDNSYVLVKVYSISNKYISLEDINYLANMLYVSNGGLNWGQLWAKKIDYLERMISEFGKKYPLLVDSFNYFAPLTENAISYFNDINIPNNYLAFISHKVININDKDGCLYNPLNIIFDYKVRDIAEYIKNAFFENRDISNELLKYLSRNELSQTDIKLLIARMLYPSFYFNLYDDILINNKDEKIIVDIINRLDDYEVYLARYINYFSSKYDTPTITWLKNKL